MKKLEDAIARFGIPNATERLPDPSPLRQLVNAYILNESLKTPIETPVSREQRMQWEIEALQKLLNEKDEALDKRFSKEMWGCAALVATVLIAAYYGFIQ